MSAGLIVQHDATCFCSSKSILFELRGSHIITRVCASAWSCVCVSEIVIQCVR